MTSIPGPKMEQEDCPDEIAEEPTEPIEGIPAEDIAEITDKMWDEWGSDA